MKKTLDFLRNYENQFRKTLKNKESSCGGGDFSRTLLKLCLFTAIFFWAGISNSFKVKAEISKGPIRVGLESSFKQVNNIKIENNMINISIKDDNNSINNIAKIYSETGFTVSPSNLYYLETENYYDDYNSANNQILTYKNNGSDAVCGYNGNKWVIYLGGYQTEAEANEALKSGKGKAVIKPNNKMISINADNGTNIVFDDKNYPLLSGEDVLILGKSSYRGYIEIGRNLGVLLNAVNIIDAEEYLKSVVPSEMPSSWNIEALKAQTVSARSYTYTKIGTHIKQGYDLCDRPHCQVYKGQTNETKNTDKAVIETDGLVIYYKEKPINATFFSSSGGVTDDSENVWANKEEYLRGVIDVFDTEGKVWSRTISFEEIDNILIASNINIGKTVSVAITEINNSGRVQKLQITGETGIKVLEKEEVRTFFSKSKGGSLESRLFTISDSAQEDNLDVENALQLSNNVSEPLLGNIYKIDGNGNILRNEAKLNTETNVMENIVGISKGIPASYIKGLTGNAVVFKGKGWGHGIGMSQHGAKGMGEAGFDFMEILKHYYRGVEIK